MHNVEARKAANVILSNWKKDHPIWKTKFIDKNDVILTRNSPTFPSPDITFYSESKKSRVVIEYKPYSTETRRGLLTGLGQSLAYLHKNNNSASYLLIPEKIEDFEIGKFLDDIFKKKIEGKLPIGLITYNIKDVEKLNLRCQISDKCNLFEVKSSSLGDGYWATWRDWSPHAYNQLLTISNSMTTKTNDRKKEIYDHWFNNYFAHTKTKQTLDLIKSKTYRIDNTKYIPLERKKNELRKKVLDKKITEKEALIILEDLMSTTTKTQATPYKNYKKNIFNFLVHLELMDSNYYISPIGKRFIKITKNNINMMNQEMAKITICQGRHGEIIKDIKNIQKNIKPFPATKEEFRNILEDELSKKGFVKKNPNRAVSASRSDQRAFLASEIQLWNHFGIIKKNGLREYFFDNIGFVFNEIKIKNLENSFKKNYGDL